MLISDAKAKEFIIRRKKWSETNHKQIQSSVGKSTTLGKTVKKNTMKIAFISCREQEKYLIGTHRDEDEILLKILLDKGLEIERTVWNDPGVNWGLYDLVLLKSPWDYHEHFSDFNAWLNKPEALGVNLLNPYRVIRWNSDKHYLKEIEDSGLPVIASLFVEKETIPELQEFFRKFKTQKLIVKPCVSASAKNTLTVTPENAAARQNELHGLLREGSFLVQPFMEEILNGELSFIFLAGRYSHCVLKLPKSDDFRIQHYYGGTIQNYEPKTQHIADALGFVDLYAGGCLYARVDGLLVKGTFLLMELELIEPFLYMEQHPEAYQHYYEALLNLINS